MKQSLLKWNLHIYFIIFCAAYSCIIVLCLWSVSVWSLPHPENVEGRMNHKYMSLNGSLALLLFLLRLFLFVVVLSFHPLSEVNFFFLTWVPTSYSCCISTPSFSPFPCSCPFLCNPSPLFLYSAHPSVPAILSSLISTHPPFIFLQLHFYWGNSPDTIYCLNWRQVPLTPWRQGHATDLRMQSTLTAWETASLGGHAGYPTKHKVLGGAVP